MNKLNRIFYGPAGTGKTRRAIAKAVEIITESSSVETKFDNTEYQYTIENLKLFTKLPELPTKINNKIIQKIQNLSISVDNVVNTLTFNDLKALVGDVQQARDKAKKVIAEYRVYPLIEMVTFHPSYSYQDFVEGITVETNREINDIEYTVKDGVFKKICKRAIDNPSYNYVLIIDEINRGDISSIFGELFTLLEDNKRKGKEEELSVNLPYSKDEKGNPQKLSVPKNLYILATMNTVDKSIALIDVALRRRFDFEECMPNANLAELKQYANVDLPKLLTTINERITILKNENYQIGHSYFLNITNFDELKVVMEKSIVPLLQEYFYDDWQSICAVLNQNYKKPKKGFLITKQNDKNIFKDEFKELIEYSNKKIFKINQEFTEQDIIDIYK